MSGTAITGGCQCGAVRYRVESLGRASVCHCRMCQKAMGNFFAPLVTAHGLVWTRGEPKTFASSNLVKRGFCTDCGTPLTFDWGGDPDIAIATLDNPELAPPAIQMIEHEKLSYVDALHELPVRTPAEREKIAAHIAGVISNQHPDHDTESWPPQEEPK